MSERGRNQTVSEGMTVEETVVKEGERLDQIGFANLRLLQKPEDFCYGIDAVLLADFAAKRAKPDLQQGYLKPVRACDLGTGTGVIPLILSHKLPQGSKIAGVEVQEDSFRRAERNVVLNGLSEQLFMVHGDVSDSALPERVYERMAFSPARGGRGGFDLVTANPPYTEGGRGLTGKNPAKQIARQETTGTLEDFIRTAAALLCEKGDFYLVHRPSRLVDLCCLFRKYRLEPKTLRLVSPKAGSAPNILLLHGVLGGGRELSVRENFIVYREDGSYTDEVNKTYER